MELKASLFCDSALNEPLWYVIFAFVRKIISTMMMMIKTI
jgi:hypothetical protein